MNLARTERRWWLAAGLWTVALYLGTALAQQAMLALRSRGLLATSVTTAFALCGLAALALVLRAGGRRRALVASFAVAALYTALLSNLTIIQERLHFIQFGVLALLALRALEARQQRLGRDGGWITANPPVTAAIVGALGGLGDELVQALVPSRVFDLRDIAFNATAAVLAVAVDRFLRSAIAADRQAAARGPASAGD